MRAAAWLFGTIKVKSKSRPTEKVVAEDHSWNSATCDVTEFAPQTLRYYQRATLEPFDQEAADPKLFRHQRERQMGGGLVRIRPSLSANCQVRVSISGDMCATICTDNHRG